MEPAPRLAARPAALPPCAGRPAVVHRRAARVLALLVALLPAMATHARAASPARVMSINVCADGLLLALLPPARITSVTWLARDPAQSARWRQARDIPVNHGTAEEVLAERPDLVVAGTYTTAATRALLTRLHVPLLVLAPAETFAQIRAITRQLAAAIGRTTQGEALIAGMDMTLAGLAASSGPRPDVLAWDGANVIAGPTTLFGAILSAAGGINRGAALAPGATLDLEQLVWLHPHILARGVSSGGDPRPLAFAGPALALQRQITYQGALAVCGTPDSAAAALSLHTALR